MKGHLHLNSITVDPRCNVPGCNRFPVTTFRWSRERSHRDTMLVSCLLHSHSLAFRDLHFVCHSWAGNDWRSAFPGCAGRDCGCCHCACKHMRNDKVMGRVGPLHHLSAATPYCHISVHVRSESRHDWVPWVGIFRDALQTKELNQRKLLFDVIT